jgi:Mg-chelatase subunit ChlD
VGEDLGRKPGKWESWLEKHKDELTVEDLPLPFDEAKFDPARVAKVRQQTGDAGTQVHKRIPPIASEIRELQDKGLDIALCLDQTSSMGPVIDEAKQRIEVLVSCVREVVREHRVGLVTYDDAVKITVPLTSDVGRLRETLAKVLPLGGMDMPEGVDKALGAALKPEFGWRSKAVRTAIVIGDAPPHEPDVEPTRKLLEQLHAQAGFVVHTVATGPELPEFEALAKAAGGRALHLGDPSKLVSEVLLLIFGETLRPAMERFVPVLIEVLAAQDAKR